MATIYHSQQRPQTYKVTHFTPQVKSCWCWIVTIPCITISGVQEVITGQKVDVGAGMTMWSSLPGSPSFDSREAAVRWVELMQLPNVSVEQ